MNDEFKSCCVDVAVNSGLRERAMEVQALTWRNLGSPRTSQDGQCLSSLPGVWSQYACGCLR
jgi:hypothetical protein